jgi:archaellum component FlaF (FlaF/FlaG flagellin family)
MKKLAAFFSLLFILSINKLSAQEESMKEFTTVEIEILKKGKLEKSIGYLISFEMPNLNSLYSAIVIEKNSFENTKQAVLSFPMKNGERTTSQVEDISKYLFSDKSNDLAIIRLGELAHDLDIHTIFTNVIFVPEDFISNFSIPLDKIKLKKLKESWENSMMAK